MESEQFNLQNNGEQLFPKIINSVEPNKSKKWIWVLSILVVLSLIISLVFAFLPNIKCFGQGGELREVWGGKRCFIKTSDGGKPCTDSSQCERSCILSKAIPDGECGGLGASDFGEPCYSYKFSGPNCESECIVTIKPEDFKNLNATCQTTNVESSGQMSLSGGKIELGALI